ncbi:MAG TPA: NAD(P)-dependent oxidoreductase, partial [Burkholderiales bacterium]
AMDNKGPLMASGVFDKPQSRVALSLKDFGIMREQAHMRGQELPFGSLYIEMLEDCVKAGAAELDNAVVTQAIARRKYQG